METKKEIMSETKAKALWELLKAIEENFSSLREEVNQLLTETENEADFYDNEYLDQLRDEVNQLEESVYRVGWNIENLENTLEDLTVVQ